MIESHEQAFNEINTILMEAWKSDPDTALIDIVWGNVAPARQGAVDQYGNPKPFLRVETRHTTSRTGSLRGPLGPKREYEGILMAYLHIQADKGAIHAMPLISVVDAAFTGAKSPGGVWFRNPKISPIGPQGSWYVVVATVTFLYDLIRNR